LTPSQPHSSAAVKRRLVESLRCAVSVRAVDKPTKCTLAAWCCASGFYITGATVDSDTLSAVASVVGILALAAAGILAVTSDRD
jgi:hypothetical protein